MNKGKRILVVLLSCVLLAGCAGKVNETGGINENSSSEEKIQKEEQQELTMGIWGIESVVKAHETACSGIETAVPEISKINLSVFATSDEFFASLPTQIAAGTAPDIVKCDITYMYEYISKGYFIPLDESVLDLSLYTDGSVDVFRIDDKLYGLPINAQPFCMIINLDLWEKYGLDEIPQTWDDVMKAAEILAKQDMPAIIFENNIVYLTSVLQSFGGGWNRGKDIDSAANVEAMDFLINMFKSGYVVTPESLGVADASSAFTQGMAPLILGGPWYNSVMKSGAPDTKFALVKIPCKSEELRAYMPTIDGYFVVKGTDDVTLASKALNYVNRKEFQEAFYQGVGAMMSNSEVRKNYFETYDTAENLKDAMEYVKDPMFPEEATKFASIASTEFSEAISNPNAQLNGKDVLDNIAAQFK